MFLESHTWCIFIQEFSKVSFVGINNGYPYFWGGRSKQLNEVLLQHLIRKLRIQHILFPWFISRSIPYLSRRVLCTEFSVLFGCSYFLFILLLFTYWYYSSKISSIFSYRYPSRKREVYLEDANNILAYMQICAAEYLSFNFCRIVIFCYYCSQISILLFSYRSHEFCVLNIRTQAIFLIFTIKYYFVYYSF